MKAELVTIWCALCGASEFTEVYVFSSSRTKNKGCSCGNLADINPYSRGRSVVDMSDH